MRRLSKILVATALVLGMVAAGTPALAQENAPPARSHAQKGNITGLSIWGILAYGGGFGAGARFAIPVGSSGIFRNNPQLSDQFAVELGADVIFWNYAGYGTETDIIPTAGFMWVFWLMHGKLGLYPKIDLGYHIYTSSIAGISGVYSGLYFQGVAGIIYRTGSVSFRGEVGSGMLKIGVALNF